MADAQVLAMLTRTRSASLAAEALSTVTVSHDVEFYFQDELTVFMVEGCLFKVHRHFLTRDSEFFRGLFACPVPPGEDVEGRTDAKPIVLYGVTRNEFRSLLRFFYDSMYNRAIDSLDEWIALLSIATRYVFDRIRELAITEISRQVIDPVRKISLANQYNIPQWLPIAFTDLIKRPEPMNDAEAESLGLRTVVRVARAREVAREKGYICCSLRSYYPYDKIYTFNDKGIMQVFYEIWPECVNLNVGEYTGKTTRLE